MKSTPMLFDTEGIDDMVITRPFQRVALVVVEATEDDVAGVAGIALFGELLDHLGPVQAADRRRFDRSDRAATPVGSATARSLSSNSPAAMPCVAVRVANSLWAGKGTFTGATFWRAISSAAAVALASRWNNPCPRSAVWRR